jgi:hypothetical protein
VTGGHQFQILPIVREQELHRVHLGPGGRQQQGLAGDIAGQGEVGGVEPMLLKFSHRRALLDEPLRAAEEVEIEAGLRANRIEVGRRCSGRAGRAQPAATGGEIHLRKQAPRGGGDRFVGLSDCRVRRCKIEVAVNRLAHHLVELRGMEGGPPVAIGLRSEVDALAAGCELLLRLLIVVLRGHRSRPLEVRSDGTGRQERE